MDLFRNGSLAQILSALSGNQQFGSLVSSGSPTREHFMEAPAVQFSSVGRATAVARPSRSGQASASVQVSRKNQKFSAVPLSEMKICKTVESYIYSLQISCVRGCGLPTCLASVCESVSADMTANRPRSWNSQEAIRTPHVFWCFSLWSPDKWSTMIHVRQTDTCVITKNPSSRVLSHVSIAKHPFICVHFRETLLHLSASAKRRPTQLTFRRTLKFPRDTVKALKVGLLMYH